MSLEKWSETITKDVYEEWKRKYNKWKPGFKVFYSPVRKNPKIMILSYNPGGNEESFQSEDNNRYQRGDFSIQNYHSYADTDKTLAKEMKRFFSNDNLLRESIPIPIIFFRSRDIRYWEKEFVKSYSRSIKKEAEAFCLKKVEEILEKINPSSILIIGTKTYDRLKKDSIMRFDSEIVQRSKYGNRNERIYVKAIWNRKPVLCVRHLSGARIKKSDLEKMKIEFQKTLDFR